MYSVYLCRDWTIQTNGTNESKIEIKSIENVYTPMYVIWV